jgi:hypothetical protein
VLGIAKLLPQIVAVKRETLQVVSLAMTGLMRDSSLVFHIVENTGPTVNCLIAPISRQWLGLPWVPFTPPGL